MRHCLGVVGIDPDRARSRSLLCVPRLGGPGLARAVPDKPRKIIDEISKGAEPGDFPMEQPMRVRTVVDLRTARALGLEIRATLLTIADEVIE